MTKRSPPSRFSNFTGGKVAIPRANVEPRYIRRPRAARACEACRRRKIKCDGIEPGCSQCGESDIICVYSDRKPVRDRKQIEQLSRKVEQYENLLQGLSAVIDDRTARKIRKALEDQGSPPSEVPGGAEESDTSSSSSVGSLRAIDTVEEDLDRDAAARATGFIGRPSQVAWMQRLASDNPEEDIPGKSWQGRDSSRRNSRSRMASVSYNLDDLDIDAPVGVDLYALPSRELADEFFGAYLETVHDSFPIIRSIVFREQYRQFFQTVSPNPGNKWLAILNMIFAIGSKYCQLADGPARDVDDRVYFNRARCLSMNGDTLFAHSDLQQIQLEGLAAFYLMSVGQINRAWKIICMACRSSVALGINLKIIDTHMNHASKEARGRVWWSLYSLENLLAVVTGRVSFMDENICSIYQPMPFEEERFADVPVMQLFRDESFRASHMQGTLLEKRGHIQTTTEWLNSIEPSRSLYFFCLVDLLRISQARLNRLYSPKVIRQNWSEIEHQITTYSAKLDVWLSKVPVNFQFDDGQLRQGDQPSSLQERARLAMQYYSTLITVCRPCVTSLSTENGKPQSHKSRFVNKTSLICVESALSLVTILPDKPDTKWLFKTLPWWSALHHIMQAGTLLLLYLSAKILRESKETWEGMDLNVHIMSTAIKKTLRWLYDLAKTGVAARRAYEFFDSFVRRIFPKIGVDIGDIPSMASLPSVSTAFPNEHHLHHPWITTLENDSSLGFGPLGPPNTTSSSVLDKGNPSSLLSESNSHLLPATTLETGSVAPFVPVQEQYLFSYPVTTLGVDYEAETTAGIPMYDSYSQEYMHSLFPAVGSQWNESEPAWQADGNELDDDM